MGNRTEINMETSDKFLSDYNSPKQIGSIHWLRTIAGNAKHCAEYLEQHPNTDLLEKFSLVMKNAFNDIIKAQELGLIKCTIESDLK